MFNISRNLDSLNVQIEFLDNMMKDYDREWSHELYKQISAFLVEEYVKEHGPAIKAQIKESEIVQGLATLIAKAIIKNVKEEDNEESEDNG